ncbi:MAG: hypothetical protein JXO51_01570 [Candidatus Aminicenantes bacterium]|nr:hypothetical protein [Candidatus Aminicenantes bacterium]
MKKQALAVVCLAGLGWAASPAGNLRAAKYPPGLRWREIERSGFTVVFPAGSAIEAAAALSAAESLNEALAAFWRLRLTGRTRIVINDSTDQANGFATFFPFNLVGVNLAEPPPDSDLASSRATLDLVLAHELTHIFNLNAGSPPFQAARRLFGTLPVFYPAAQMPPWVLEGMAVEGESRFSGDGRLDHPHYRLMLGAARRDGLFPSWSRIAGMPAAWPGGTSRYLYGAGFMEFLKKRHGVDSLRRYLERISGQLLLTGSSRDFKKAFGEPLKKLWHEYRDSIPVIGEPGPEPLTKNGFFQLYPCALGGNRLAYFRRDYRSRGEVVILDLNTGQEKILFKMDAVNGLCVAEKGKKIVLSAIDNYHAFSEFSDLYEYDLEKRKRRRLSRGQRLSQPAKADGSDRIHCIQRRGGRYHLALFDTKNGKVRSMSRAFTGMAQPAVSPDGSMVAVAVKSQDGGWALALYTSEGKEKGFVSLQGADLSQPRWRHDGALFFILADRESSRLASISIGGGGAVCTDPRLSGLRHFDLSRDGGDVYFTFFSGRGLEISRSAVEGLPFSPLEMTVASEIPEPPPELPPPASRPYRPWRDLLPRWWAPAWRLGGDEFQAGFMTGGQDALATHGYSLEGYYGLSSRRGNFLFSYVYDGLFPTLSFIYSDGIDYYRGSRSMERSQELKLASLWPLRVRRRSQIFAYAGLHQERRSYIDANNTYVYPGSFNGFRLGLSFNSAREYYDSVSQTDGVRFSAQGFIHPEGLGNPWASRGLQLDLRNYIPLFRPGVLAWRLAAAQSWGAENCYYAMGGFTAESGLGSCRPFKLLRGLDAGYYRGDRGWQFNLEYRLPLFNIEKALLPAVSLDRVWLKPFLDAGRLAYDLTTHPLAFSAGIEAVLRLAFGGLAAYDLAFGVARGFEPEKRWWLFLRTGSSF